MSELSDELLAEELSADELSWKELLCDAEELLDCARESLVTLLDEPPSEHATARLVKDKIADMPSKSFLIFLIIQVSPIMHI